ncbi:MAG: response regulator [Chloroflexi bacterium]|nr:response regulator [Chloroflexota bacterium]
MSDSKILIVEDEGIEALDIQHRLTSLGYPTPEIVFSGEDAIQKAEDTSPDLVLMDIMLNGKIDGINAAEQIHARYDIPVIYLTAYADEDTLRRAKITEPYGYIVKPFKDREVHITIDMALYRHRMEKKLKESEKALRKANDELESRVAERTADLALTNKHLKQEIEQRKQAEYRLEEKRIELENAKLAKDRFLASMSYELSTALNAIIAFTSTLLSKLSGPLSEDQEKQLQMIRSSAQHLLSLIYYLLDLARIESGKVEISTEPVDVTAVIREVVSTMRPMAEQKGLAFTDNMPAGQLMIRTHRRALSQILLNLTNNGIKFTEKGQVRLEFAQHRRGVNHISEISIVDTGPGIKEDDQKKLFEGFRQLDSALLRTREGTGLGLHLSQKLAELIGGEITCKSCLGKGSTFTLTLK